jgi:hypothetical protein
MHAFGIKVDCVIHTIGRPCCFCLLGYLLKSFDGINAGLKSCREKKNQKGKCQPHAGKY